MFQLLRKKFNLDPEAKKKDFLGLYKGDTACCGK